MIPATERTASQLAGTPHAGQAIADHRRGWRWITRLWTRTPFSWAVLVTAVAIAVQGFLDSWWGHRLAMVILPAAVAAAVWLGGYRPALLIALLGYLACAYQFLVFREEAGGVAIPTLSEGLAYLVSCASMIALGVARGVAKVQAKAQPNDEMPGRRDRPPSAPAQQWLAAIVDSSDDAIIGKTLEGVILSWNAGAERLFGYTAAEAVGQSIELIIPPERRAEERLILERLRRGERIDHFETVRLTKAGRRLEVSLTISPVLDEAGRLIGASKVARDLSERYRAAETAQHADEAARAAQRRLETILAGLSDQFLLFDPTWRCVFVNDRVTEATGRSKPDLLGKTWWEVFPELAVTDFEWAARRAMAEQCPVQFAFQDLASGRWFEHHLYPSAEGLTVLITDITDRQQAEDALRASEARFRQVFENAPTGIAIKDGQGRFQQCNPAYCTLLGYTQEELCRLEFSSLVHPADRAANLAEIRRLQAGEIPFFKVENRYVRKDGEVVWVHKFVSVLQDQRDALTHLMVLVTDVTERRRIEDVLCEADRRKDEFLAMLAHELRNPLAPIRSAVQVLNRLGPAEPKQQWARTVIERQVKHLARLVDDLLDSARLIRGQITLKKEPVELATMIQQTLDVAQPLLTARQHHFHLVLPHSPVWLEGDPVRLVQVLLNLLDNAAKYTEPGGRIELEAEVLGTEVAVRVRDTGSGLSPALLSRAFELFEQGERTLDRTQGGLGIGLTLVRRLVELHGGRVEAHSAGLGQGAEFTVWLPVLSTGAPPTEVTASPTAVPSVPSPRAGG